MTSRRRQPPVEGSWRLVEGENDSFGTTILPGFSDEDDDNDVLAPNSSGQPSSQYPSQLSNLSQGGGHIVLGSQDSIRDFSRHQDDDHNILREPFRPSLPGSRSSYTHRSPDPEFRMPVIDIDAGRGGGGNRQQANNVGALRDERGARLRRKMSKNSPSKRHYRYEESDEEDEEPRTLRDRIFDSVPKALLDVLLWALGVVALSFRYAQKPLALLLAIYVSFGAIIMAQNMITKSLSTSLSPLCWVPGASLLNLPFCSFPSSATADGFGQHVEFDDLMSVQANFEKVLEKSAEGVSLPIEMKRSESTIRDLRTLVRHSDIKARDELVLEFDGYIDVARQSSSDLQRFNTHVGSAVDGILAINRFTSRYIDSLDPSKPENVESALSQWTSWFFFPFTPSSRGFDERIILDKYIEHTALVSDRIGRLIIEAQSVLRLLEKAEGHLSQIHSVSSQSSKAISSDRSQVFWNLWTFLGANSKKLHNLAQQLLLLRQVDTQRNTAIAQVSALIIELEGIQAGLGDLRDRVAAPELLRDPATKSGPIPLSVHIETINGGVERLEDARRRIKAAEDDRVRDALHRGGIKDEPLIESR